MGKRTFKSSAGIIKTLLFVAGLLIFAGFLHQSIPLILLSFSGLLLSVVVIVSEIHRLKDLCVLFDCRKLTGKNIFYLPVSIIIGLAFGIIYRDYLHISIIPSGLTGFAATAMAIGSSEEILFRGYLQSRIRKSDVVLSVVMATFAHSAYKLLLFIPYRSEPDIEISFILQWTLLGGLVFAILKEFSKNSIYPVISHALFDLWVYGDGTVTPWWVWT
ncbi:MAG: CPBP family intramembrane metalloprotease [Bacteroidales bacterium]|nr:CPBP family intramembrane metalloprotease [Bacteroidales bacterium]